MFICRKTNRLLRSDLAARWVAAGGLSSPRGPSQAVQAAQGQAWARSSMSTARTLAADSVGEHQLLGGGDLHHPAPLGTDGFGFVSTEEWNLVNE